MRDPEQGFQPTHLLRQILHWQAKQLQRWHDRRLEDRLLTAQPMQFNLCFALCFAGWTRILPLHHKVLLQRRSRSSPGVRHYQVC